MWRKRDWHVFYSAQKPRSGRMLPPRPVQVTRGLLLPAEGFSLRELDDAGISLEQAERVGLPVEGGRSVSYAPNVAALRVYARAARLGDS